MGFFTKFRKSKSAALPLTTLTAMVSGTQIKIENVKDEVFSQKMMGEGVAIKPSSGKIVAPAPGIITSIYPTNHAINLKLDSGVDAIIHIGIDTVELNGKGFNKKVVDGQKVTRGDLLVQLDQNLLSSNRDLTTILVFPELSDKKLSKVINENNVVAGISVVGEILINKELKND
ncbi:MAG: PTS sugar transporter subunit IIA [Lactobacillus panisapium]|uniref:PTS sugar transporter subunit IIA n=1 Tax=Lactobacillus sp. TaxID=1591 RepID=UPI0025F4DF5A|nr:PTS glucose transporter subunit IIA [Lactobacillus sp.]MCT6821099.1 PTS glucose transporter subunit IIA [Lactobacillus panisapium]MCT6853062.1 PTS glucose transporter subunit IIA [Lactobacillus panisapium]